MSDGFIWIFPQSSLPAIDVVQNVYDDLGLSQSVERDGSEWTRSVLDEEILEQSISDFYGETITSTLVLSSSVGSDQISLESASSTITLTQTTTVAGGRVDSGGGGGDTNNSFGITYDSGGATTEEGLWVYVDPSDGEAKLATNATAVGSEVAGYIDDAYDAGDPATVVTEGEIEKVDWTNVAGTTTLTRGAYYYLHTGGQMRVTPPVSGAVVILGRAMTATRFDTEINPPVDL